MPGSAERRVVVLVRQLHLPRKLEVQLEEAVRLAVVEARERGRQDAAVRCLTCEREETQRDAGEVATRGATVF